MSTETLQWLLPLLVPVIVTTLTIIANGWIQHYKTKHDTTAVKATTKVAAEDNFRDDLLKHNKDLIDVEKSYREELRQVELRYREHVERIEAKYDVVLQTVRDLQNENAFLRLENKQLSIRVKELENEVAKLEQRQQNG